MDITKEAKNPLKALQKELVNFKLTIQDEINSSSIRSTIERN